MCSEIYGSVVVSMREPPAIESVVRYSPAAEPSKRSQRDKEDIGGWVMEALVLLCPIIL